MSGWHAKLSASSSPRWMACPGSVRECEGIKDVPSRYAAEGTVAHEVGARCLEQQSLPEQYIGEEIEADGFKFTVDRDMTDAVWEYVKHIDYLRCEAGSGHKFHVEVALHEEMVKLHPDLGGTADCVIFSPARKVLDVVDYKHGSGVLVSVEGNKQLTYYALGALLSFPGYTPETVRLTVVQPRCESAEPVRSYEFSVVELLEFEQDLVEAAKRTEDPNAPLVPGDHCKAHFCPAAHKCPALQKHTDMIVSSDFDVLDTVPSVDLKAALDILPAVEARIKAIREFAYQQAVEGNPPEGYKLVDKKGRRHWTDEETVKGTIELMLSEDDVQYCWTEPQLRSVAQVEKAIGKKDFAKLLGDLTAMVSSGYTLVKDSDPRAPASLQLASPDEFDNL